jgi:hypothetical protein
MRKIFWTMILLATLSASVQASAETVCDAWRKDWGNRTQVFNAQCVRSSLNYSQSDYCTQEAAALQRQRFRILNQCH